MVIFDNESRQFSVVEDQREYGAGTAVAVGAGLGTAYLGRKIYKDLKKDKKRTLLGKISGKNKALDRQDEMKHEEHMAKLNNKYGLQNRGADRKELGMGYRHEENMAKMAPGTKTTAVPWKKRI